MAVNLAEKYSEKVAERFKLKSLSHAFFNHDYKWDGVNAINVYSVDVAPMNDYQKTGTSRYGNPSELGDTVQKMTLTKDRSFTYTIDKGNSQDQLNVKGAGRSLARQHDEAVVPEIDAYNFKTLATGATLKSTATPITEANAYKEFLAGQEKLTDELVPVTGRKAACTTAFFTKIKLDPSFVKNSDLGQKITINGQVGEIDGVPLVVVPKSLFPDKTDFIIVHPSAATEANKLQEYKIHDNPPGINGNLVEGRVRYDAFVLNAKKKGIYVHINA